MRTPESSSDTSRRTFLTTTSAALGAASMSMASGVHLAGSGVIKIGMIGCGDRCTGAAYQALATGKDVRLVAMADIFRDRLDTSLAYLKAEFPDQVEVDANHAAVGFDGYKTVIEAADVVEIACASKFHPMYAGAAIDAGKHVFVEKPHAIDPVGLRQVRAVSERAQSKGLSLVSGLQSRYHRGWQETVKRIHDGEIGDIVAIQAMFLRGPYRLNPREPGLTETQYQFRNWYHFRWLSGDDVTQSLVHNLDRASWVLQEEKPTWAFGLGGRSSSFGDEFGDMFDHHTAVYEYASGTRIYALCRTQRGCYGNSGDIIMGSKGTCNLAGCKIEGEVNWTYEGPQSDPYGDEQRALIDSVRNGRPINSGSYMADSTLIAIMGQMACYSGKPITWDEALRSEVQFGPVPEASTFDTPPPALPDATGNYPLPRPGITRLA